LDRPSTNHTATPDGKMSIKRAWNAAGKSRDETSVGERVRIDDPGRNAVVIGHRSGE
jgi:hypothetical protein